MKTNISVEKLSSASLSLLLLASVLSVFSGDMRGDTMTLFDAPGAYTTLPSGINSSGDIVGTFVDYGNVSHSFLRLASGAFVIFDVPGAPVAAYTNGTRAASINDSGQITGSYITDLNAHSHGFLQENNGSFTTFDALPNDNGYGTQSIGINASGDVTGSVNFNSHDYGFLRTHDGTITTFDVSGSTGGTYPGSINVTGVISGHYLAGNGQFGFVRAADGTFKTFGLSSPWRNWPNGLNDSGAIATSGIAVLTCACVFADRSEPSLL